MLPLSTNPIADAKPEADLSNIDAPTVYRRTGVKKDIRDARRASSAADAIGQLTRKEEIYGFTKGQFSVIDILTHLLTLTGPARLQLSTWTAAKTDITTVLELCQNETVTSARWLVDFTFNRRSPALAQSIRQQFGADAIRFAQNHAKFFLLSNDQWQLVCFTSMNLNFNPRFENFTLGHNPELWDFHNRILDEIWQRQDRRVQDLTPSQIRLNFGDL